MIPWAVMDCSRYLWIGSFFGLLACGSSPTTPGATGTAATGSTSGATSGATSTSASTSGEPSTSGATVATSGDLAPSSGTTTGAVCGDGVVEGAELCDDGKDGDDEDECTDLCAPPTCGDGLVQPGLGEACDLGADNNGTGACTSWCAQAECGDGVVWEGHEECDAGDLNGIFSDCTEACVLATCGDGIVRYSEQCDDGNDDDDDACSNSCHVNSCPGCPMLIGLFRVPNFWWGVSYGDGKWHLTYDHAVADAGLAITSDGVGVAVFSDLFSKELGYRLLKDGAWTDPVTLGPGVTSGPRVSRNGKGVHVVYRGADLEYYYAGFDGEAWGPLAEPIGAVAGSLGAVADVDNDAVYVFHEGLQDPTLASRVRSGGWQPTQFIEMQPSMGTPGVVALDGGAELLAHYGARYSVRKAGDWAAVKTFDAGGPVKLAALPGGGAVAAWIHPGHDAISTIRYDVNSDAWGPPTIVVEGLSDGPFGELSGGLAVAAGIAGAEIELMYEWDPSGSVGLIHLHFVDGEWKSVWDSGPNIYASSLTLASSAAP